jgi:hypothetical protein
MSSNHLADVADIAPAARRGEHVVITKFSLANPFRRTRKAGRPGLDTGRALLVSASVLLAALAVAMGVVSWNAQFRFVDAVKHQHLAATLEALGLDAGAVIFAVLGIALAGLGRRAVIERALVALCAAGSCGMNLLGANLGSPRSVAVYVMPPVLFAVGSDRLTAVIRRAALGPQADDGSQRSAWPFIGRVVLYGLRLVLAPPSTVTGARRALLDATPLPGIAEVVPLAIEPPIVTVECPLCRQQATVISGYLAEHACIDPADEGEDEDQQRRPRERTKTSVFLALVGDRYGDLGGIDLEKVGRICAELAAGAGMNEGAARKALRSAVLAAQAGGSR